MSRSSAPILAHLAQDPRTAEDIAERAGMSVAETVVALGVQWWPAQCLAVTGLPGFRYRLRDVPAVSFPVRIRDFPERNGI